jgi:hypothetical protein
MELTNALVVRDRAEIGEVPWQPVPACRGVFEKELWRQGDFVDALIRYDPGSTAPGGPHGTADHHIWVVSGAATIAGRPVEAGSYVYVPRGTSHPIGDVGQDGCIMLQMHRPSLDR